MMSANHDTKTMSNAEVARRAIELVTAFEFDELATLIHEDIVMEAPYQAFHAGPMRRGRESFMEGMSMVPNLFKAFSLNIHALYDCPADDVVVLEMTSLGVFLAPDPKAHGGPRRSQRFPRLPHPA